MSHSSPHYEWIEEFRSGDHLGFKKAYEEFFYPLSYFAMQLVNNPAAAEEIASDALYTLMQRHADFTHYKHIRDFLYKVVRHRCIDYQRKQQQRSTPQLTALDDSLMDTDEHALNILIKAELLEEIYRQIQRLSPLKRTVFTQSFLEDRSIREIADYLGITESTVRSVRSTAAAELRTVLGRRKFLLLLTAFTARFKRAVPAPK